MQISVAIKSCHKHHARRQAQLDTWLPQLQADYFFIIGNPRLVMPDTLSCDVSDRFEDIAPKILCACLSMLDANVDFGFFCDDDTYVRPDRLLGSNFRQHDYVGFVRPYGDTSTGGLPYIQGSAYWLSARAMEHIARAGATMRPGIIDDGAVGMALDGKVALTHNRLYWPGPEPFIRPLLDNDIISTHKCLPPMMQQVHQPFAGARRG